MKIVQVCPYDFSRHGGVKTHIIQLTDALRKLGHQVYIIAPIGTETVSHPNLHCFGRNFSIPFLGTKIDINAVVGSEKRRIKKFLKDENFDLIHFHTIWNPLLPLQILFLTGAKKVATFHDTPKNNWIGKFLGRWVMPVMARVIFIKLDGIISVSKTQSKFITRFSNRQVTIIPNGISVPDIINDVERDPNQLLFLGRFEPRKGLMAALKVFKLIQKSHPNVKLKIVGEGDLQKKAENFVVENNLQNVEFLGKVNDEEKWEMYQSTHIYIASAEYGESFGIVLVEAMAMGSLLCGYANEGYKNVLSDRQLKFFTEPGDINRLVKKALQLLDLKSDEFRTLQKEGEQIVQNYHWAFLVESILEVYQDSNRP